MKRNCRNEVHRINYLAAEIDSLYHIASVKLGISDSVSVVLYTVFDEGGESLLKDIYQKSGINKQTVNSAVRGLEKKGIIFLEQYNGKSKKVVLTEKGREFAEKTVKRLYDAETDALNAWTDEEINEYIRLLEKHKECFCRQIAKL